MKYLITILGVLFSTTATCQEFTLNNKNSTCTIAGTSTLHDWEIVAENLTGRAEVTINEGEIETIQALNFSVEVNGLKSGKGGMDRNTYKALKSNRFPIIKYEFVRVIEKRKTSDGNYLKTVGKLTVAGKTNTLYLDVTALSNEGISFIGESTFKMTDYDVDPPVALMGAVKTGDEITITFNVQYLN